MPLKDIDSEKQTRPVGPKTSSLEFRNPEWNEIPDHNVSMRFNSEDEKKYFEATRWAVTYLSIYRHQLVGEFLHAVMEFEENANADPMKNLIDALKTAPVRNLTDIEEADFNPNYSFTDPE